MSISCVSQHVTLRAHDEIYLIGHVTNQIVGSKLPSCKQVLCVLFYNIRKVKLNLRESARLAIKETSVFWEKARIPVRDEQHCISKLEKVYKTWRDLQKLSKRISATQKVKIDDFVGSLDDLFYIAHANALQMIRIEEDRQFLLLQRKKGRPGCMIGPDIKLAEVESVKMAKLQKLEKRRKRSLLEVEKTGNFYLFIL